MSLQASDHQVVQALLNRRSTPPKFLHAPAPQGETLELILRCALSAPDHGAVRPWRFSVLSDENRQALADGLQSALIDSQPSASANEQENIQKKALRAPMIIAVAAATRDDHPKVPRAEQIEATAVAAEHIQLAANAMGFGSIWVTGPYANHRAVKAAFGFDEALHMVAMIYIGTSDAPKAKARDEDLAPFLVRNT